MLGIWKKKIIAFLGFHSNASANPSLLTKYVIIFHPSLLLNKIFVCLFFVYYAIHFLILFLFTNTSI